MKSPGLKGLGLKLGALGVEKSGVEMSFNPRDMSLKLFEATFVKIQNRLGEILMFL